MAVDDLPLSDWQSASKLIVFPLCRRVGKIRDVAGKLLTKTTDRHANSYREQVSTALFNHLKRVGLPKHQQDEQIAAFWSATDVEIARLTYRGQRPGGDAA